MLRLKMTGLQAAGTIGTWKIGTWKKAGILAAGMLMAATPQGWAQATSSSSDGASPAPAQTTRTVSTAKIGPAAPVTYDNKYEIYGGINFMNFQAGDHLPTRMNMGGGEVMGTYWLPSGGWYSNLGIAADFRIDAGTTPVFANQFVNNRPLVYMYEGMAGVQYRGPKNQHVAVDYHALFGVAYGVFTYSTKDVPPFYYPTLGLYDDSTKPMGALGGSIDFNRSKNLAIRLQPDLILEHFGSETREFFAISGGVVYRFHKER